MTIRMLAIGLVAAGMASAAAPARAQGDAAAGEKIFNKCKTCHFVDQAKNKIGPHLVGIFGRPAGAVEDFKYSDAMKNAGIVWEDDTLTQYLQDPRGYIPGNRMAFAGLKKEDEIQNLLAYLHEAAGEGGGS